MKGKVAINRLAHLLWRVKLFGWMCRNECQVFGTCLAFTRVKDNIERPQLYSYNDTKWRYVMNHSLSKLYTLYNFLCCWMFTFESLGNSLGSLHAKAWPWLKHDGLCRRFCSGETHSRAVTSEGNQSRHGQAPRQALCRIWGSQGQIRQHGIKRMSDKSVAKRSARLIFSLCI